MSIKSVQAIRDQSGKLVAISSAEVTPGYEYGGVVYPTMHAAQEAQKRYECRVHFEVARGEVERTLAAIFDDADPIYGYNNREKQERRDELVRSMVNSLFGSFGFNGGPLYGASASADQFFAALKKAINLRDQIQKEVSP